MNYANQFFKEFITRVTWEKFHDYYVNDASFTPIVTKEIRDIICSMGWQPTGQYFRIDIVGYESKWESVKELTHNAGLGAYLWNLKIAVEHENSKKAWTDELIKLMQIRCPLKVIISYNYYDERPEGDWKKLAVAADLMKKTDSYPSIKRDGEEILIILGNGCSKKTKKSDYTSFDYRGYLYNYSSELFDEITIDGNLKNE